MPEGVHLAGRHAADWRLPLNRRLKSEQMLEVTSFGPTGHTRDLSRGR
jgi:hypothetical protein